MHANKIAILRKTSTVLRNKRSESQCRGNTYLTILPSAITLKDRVNPPVQIPLRRGRGTGREQLWLDPAAFPPGATETLP